jgi:hypothetical protein
MVSVDFVPVVPVDLVPVVDMVSVVMVLVDIGLALVVPTLPEMETEPVTGGRTGGVAPGRAQQA